MKTIVTHISPDLDALTSSWLIKKYYPGWKNAIIKLVPAGSTLGHKDPDADPEIIHVDTGFGKFDHHQADEFTSASMLVYKFLTSEKNISLKDNEALGRFITLVTELDHFREYFYPDPSADRYNILLHEIIEGLKSTLDDQELINLSFQLLNSALSNFKNKINAEREIKKGFIFRTYLGKSVILETKNSEAGKLAMKNGFNLVITKNPDKGYVRIKSPPVKNADLTPVYKKVLKLDPHASWFFHSSKRMLINGSAKNPSMKPSALTIPKLIEIAKSV